MNLYHHIASQKSLRSRLQLGRTCVLVWRSAPLWTVLNGLFVLIEGLLPLLSLYLLKRIIDALAAGMHTVAGNAAEAFTHAGWLIAGLAAVSALAAIMKACGGLVVEAHSEAVTDYVQTTVQAKSVQVDFEAFESPEYHDLLQQVQSQATFRPARIARGLFTATRSLITGAGLAALIITFYWQLGILLLLFSLPAVIVRLKHAHRLLNWHGRQSEDRRRAGYLHVLLTGATYAKEIRLFGLGEVLKKRAKQQRRRLRKAKLQLERKRALFELIPNLSAVAALFASIWLVARRAMLGLITIGDIVIYYQAFQRCQSALSEFLGALVHFYEDSLFLGLYYRFLDIQPQITSKPDATKPQRPMREGFKIEGLTFRYPGTDRDVLRGVTLDIPAGRILAVVGENGAGKSTLAKLLCRLYDPTAGTIRLNGIDLRDYELDDYRHQISAVFQDFNQYSLTARENIWFGNVGLDTADPRIEQAARLAGIDSVIGGLGGGYDTVLGREFQGGEALSAGQWQRMALARALLRDAQILILDEPTSAMDPKAEHALHQTIREMTANRTTLLISHRLSTVTMADCICVLDQGRVVEIGTHQELQRQGGLYADLFERQSRAYR